MRLNKGVVFIPSRRTRLYACSMAIAALAFGTVGCEREYSTIPAAPATKPAQVTGTAGPAAVDAAPAETRAATGSADRTNAPASAEEALRSARPSTQPGDASQRAKALMDQAGGYIKENKWELADGAVKQLERMKDSLPSDVQQQVNTLRSMLDTNKGTGGIEVPGFGR